MATKILENYVTGIFFCKEDFVNFSIYNYFIKLWTFDCNFRSF